MLYSMHDPVPALDRPVIVSALDGWVDAAGAASIAGAQLAEGGRRIASFDPDALFDYRSRRPVLDVADGMLRELTWPELRIDHVRPDDRTDMLVLSGAEPDLNWQGLSEQLSELCHRLEVRQWITLGAIPAAVPHTRPVPVMATASAEGLLRNGERLGPEGQLRVPAAAISVLEMAAMQSGIPAVGFFAQIPPYAAAGYTAGAVALLQHLERHLDLVFPLQALREAARQEYSRYDAAVENDPETKEIVDRLELMDEEEQLPTGDELASELERFLREHNEDESSGPGFGSAG